MKYGKLPKTPRLVSHTSSDSTMDLPGFFPAGVVHVKLDNEILGANTAAVSILGYPEGFELRDKKFLEICSSLDSEAWSVLLSTLDESRACEFSAVFLNYLGEHVELNCVAMHEVGASVVDIFLSSAEQGDENYDAVFRKLEICESFLETGLMDINIKNTDLEYEVTSGLFERTFSLRPGAAIGKTSKDIYPPEFADHVTSHDQMVLDSKQVVTQIDVVPFSGKHLLVQKFPLYRNNSISGIGVFAVDVTSLKDTERRLLESKNKFSDYVDLCEDILWETDRQWRLRESNISDVPDISGIELKNGEDLLELLKASLAIPEELDQFIASLEMNEIHKRVFELKNGFRMRLGIKPCSTPGNDTSESEPTVIYRGIITILRTG